MLLTLGKPGGNPPGADAADPASFYRPNDVITYPNGDILVAEGHGGPNSRLILFDKTGKFIKQFGKRGSGLEGEFDQPHGLAFDSQRPPVRGRSLEQPHPGPRRRRPSRRWTPGISSAA